MWEQTSHSRPQRAAAYFASAIALFCVLAVATLTQSHRAILADANFPQTDLDMIKVMVSAFGMNLDVCVCVCVCNGSAHMLRYPCIYHRAPACRFALTICVVDGGLSGGPHCIKETCRKV